MSTTVAHRTRKHKKFDTRPVLDPSTEVVQQDLTKLAPKELLVLVQSLLRAPDPLARRLNVPVCTSLLQRALERAEPSEVGELHWALANAAMLTSDWARAADHSQAAADCFASPRDTGSSDEKAEAVRKATLAHQQSAALDLLAGRPLEAARRLVSQLSLLGARMPLTHVLMATAQLLTLWDLDGGAVARDAARQPEQLSLIAQAVAAVRAILRLHVTDTWHDAPGDADFAAAHCAPAARSTPMTCSSSSSSAASASSASVAVADACATALLTEMDATDAVAVELSANLSSASDTSDYGQDWHMPSTASYHTEPTTAFRVHDSPTAATFNTTAGGPASTRTTITNTSGPMSTSTPSTPSTPPPYDDAAADAQEHALSRATALLRLTQHLSLLESMREPAFEHKAAAVRLLMRAQQSPLWNQARPSEQLLISQQLDAFLKQL